MRPAPKRRTVHTEVAERRCLYCLSGDGPFISEEHVIPRSLGSETERFVIPPGGVCDPCNHWLGAQVDAPFVDRFDMRMTRALHEMRGRKGVIPKVIESQSPTARFDVDIDGAKVTFYASVVTHMADGTLEIEIQPKIQDPPDVVARTI
jgi:hypothetical protein